MKRQILITFGLTALLTFGLLKFVFGERYELKFRGEVPKLVDHWNGRWFSSTGDFWREESGQ